MANMNVTYADMHDASSRLNRGEDEIRSNLAQLKSLVDSLISGGYVTDKSSVAFGDSYREFDDGANKTIAGLTGMSTYLKKAADSLQQTDDELAGSIRN
jgi:WXG100 family type VII secretion target